MTMKKGPTPEIWADIAGRGDQVAVRVKAIGEVGVGKSTFCTDFVERYSKKGRFIEIFKAGDGVQSVDSGGKTARVNPDLLPPNVTMYIQDGDGFGGLGKSIKDVTEQNLRDIKDKPAVLLVVASALRGPVALINQLQLLKIASDINGRNCFLLLTKAGRKGNQRLREPARQAFEYDPREYLAELERHGVNFFEVGRNVACVDLDPLDDLRYDTVERVRAAMCDLRPLVVRQTYDELLTTTRGELVSLQRDQKVAMKMISSLETERKWYPLWSWALAVGQLCTILVIPGSKFAGPDSKVKDIDESIKYLKKNLSSVEQQMKGAAIHLAMLEKLV
ncbi:hypothetical protein H9P43_008743 [Blastocladiella emersonii ATCC 22665]|nr:hypothetical protein H9P43_008743 [Blastocladiella emersonii ATCC 22665]